MQLDRTRVAIRERNILDLGDLALQVTRDFRRAPRRLRGRHRADGDRESFADRPAGRRGAPSTLCAYIWNMALLLVHRSSRWQPRRRRCFWATRCFSNRRRCGKSCKTLSAIQMAGRCLPDSCFAACCPPGFWPARCRTFDLMPGDFLLPLLALYLVIVRGMRPYINEIMCWSNSR